jgi:hypothetical protein
MVVDRQMHVFPTNPPRALLCPVMSMWRISQVLLSRLASVWGRPIGLCTSGMTIGAGVLGAGDADI